MSILDRRFLKNFIWLIIGLSLILSALGALNLYSASLHSGLHLFKKQLIWIAVGVGSMVFVSFISGSTMQRYAFRLYFICILALVAVLVFGKEVSGSKSWIVLGSFSVQPSEFVKIAAVLVLARFYHYSFHDGPFGLGELMGPILSIVPISVLIILQPDFGTLLVILLICGSLLAFVGIEKKSLLAILALLIAVSIPTWHFLLKDYQRERVLTFVDPLRDPKGTGYNSIQSQIAVGSGKLTGKGFSSGTQSQLRFIPEQETDFVFSVLAEEWGFVGAVFVLMLYFLLIFFIFDVASSTKDKFSMMVSLGIAMLFFWHACLNVGMVLGLLPIIGVPLLFFSYGGSSVVTAFIAIGIVVGIKLRQLPPLEGGSLWIEK